MGAVMRPSAGVTDEIDDIELQDALTITGGSCGGSSETAADDSSEGMCTAPPSKDEL